MEKSFLSVPVGAGKKHVVMMNGQSMAGFDSLQLAQAYIAMQMAKANHNKRGSVLAFAAKQTWTFRAV